LILAGGVCHGGQSTSPLPAYTLELELPIATESLGPSCMSGVSHQSMVALCRKIYPDRGVWKIPVIIDNHRQLDFHRSGCYTVLLVGLVGLTGPVAIIVEPRDGFVRFGVIDIGDLATT